VSLPPSSVDAVAEAEDCGCGAEAAGPLVEWPDLSRLRQTSLVAEAVAAAASASSAVPPPPRGAEWPPLCSSATGPTPLSDGPRQFQKGRWPRAGSCGPVPHATRRQRGRGRAKGTPLRSYARIVFK
jgi:hypothetical protein